jgi:hypothetical protein
MGAMGKRGRKKAAGRVFYLGRVRWEPGDSTDLLALLEAIERAEQGRKMRMVKAALLGGAGEAKRAAEEEDAVVGELMDGLISGM